MTTWDDRMRSTPAKVDPQLQRLELQWILRAPTGRELRCDLYQVAFGLEVRVTFPGEDLVRSERVADRTIGRTLARAWMQSILETRPDDFTILELPLLEEH